MIKRFTRFSAITFAGTLLAVNAGAAGDGFRVLTDLPTGVEELRAFNLSGDGLTLLGLAKTTGQNGYGRAFTWNRVDGTEMLLNFSSQQQGSFARAINHDGSLVVGFTSDSSAAVQWPDPSSPETVFTLPSTYSFALATSISGDSSVVSGLQRQTSGNDGIFFYREGVLSTYGQHSTQFDTIVAGPSLSGDGAMAYGVSADSGDLNQMVMWRFRQQGGYQTISPGTSFTRLESLGSANDDGSLFVGYGRVASGTATAFIWDGSADVLPKGTGDAATFAWDLSDDGSLVIGTANNAGTQRAVIWVDRQIMDVADYLTAHGMDLGDWTLLEGISLSADGNVLAGVAQNSEGFIAPFVATIPEPAGFFGLLIGGAWMLQRRCRTPVADAGR